MIYEMKLNDEPFQKIRDGKKTIELRLFDENRRKLELGDHIIFSKVGNPDEVVAAKVNALYRSKSFRELFEDISIEKCGNSKDVSIETMVNSIRKYYSEEDENHYGVLGIKIELVDLSELLENEKKFAEAQFEHYFPDGVK